MHSDGEQNSLSYFIIVSMASAGQTNVYRETVTCLMTCNILILFHYNNIIINMRHSYFLKAEDISGRWVLIKGRLLIILYIISNSSTKP